MLASDFAAVEQVVKIADKTRAGREKSDFKFVASRLRLKSIQQIVGVQMMCVAM